MSCIECRGGDELGFDFTMAFQPIVDLSRDRIWGHEALVRGINGEGAGHILSRVTDDVRYRFDQNCRVKAIELAGDLFPDDGSRLSINFMPNAVYEPAACIRTTLMAAARVGFCSKRIVFEFTENEPVTDIAHVNNIISVYRRHGFLTAIDDFGAGFAGLTVLSSLMPDMIKIDMELIRDVNENRRKQAIVQGLTAICGDLGIIVLAEGVESEPEATALRDMGIHLMQGFYFARPKVAGLPAPRLAHEMVT